MRGSSSSNSQQAWDVPSGATVLVLPAQPAADQREAGGCGRQCAGCSCSAPGLSCSLLGLERCPLLTPCPNSASSRCSLLWFKRRLPRYATKFVEMCVVLL